jgi:hypothetical protein
MGTFIIAPASSRYLWFIIPIMLLLTIVPMVMVMSIRGSRNATFEVRTDGLEIHGDLYGRFIPTSHLKLQDARRVDLQQDRTLRPSARTMGTALPGYQSGWFRLRNGEKALLYLTDRSRAVYVPTSEGFSVLVSPTDADGFLAALRKLGP